LTRTRTLTFEPLADDAVALLDRIQHSVGRVRQTVDCIALLQHGRQPTQQRALGVGVQRSEVNDAALRAGEAQRVELVVDNGLDASDEAIQLSGRVGLVVDGRRG
jgi:hypothetical protein